MESSPRIESTRTESSGFGSTAPRSAPSASQCLAALAFLAYYRVFGRHLHVIGDENHYVDASLAIGRLLASVLRMDWEATGPLVDTIVARGWFMPGMSILLAPVVGITDAIPAMRLAIGLLNLALVWAILHRLRADFGPRAEALFLCATWTLPFYGMFCFVFWGDLLAAHLFLLVGLNVTRRLRDPAAHPFTTRHGAALGLALAVATYLRSAYLLCLPLALLCIFLSSSAAESTAARLRHLARVGLACTAVFATCLAPWTVAVSARYGHHLTVTSRAMSQILTFGTDEYLDSVHRNLKYFRRWRWLDKHIHRSARQAGVSYATQAGIELDAALEGLPFEEYARRVKDNLDAHFLQSEEYVERLRESFRCESGPGRIHAATPAVLAEADWHPQREALFDAVGTFNHRAWRLLFLAGLALFLAPGRRERRGLMHALWFKYLFFLFSVQPFVVVSHGRYYVQYVPLIAAALAVALASLSEANSTPRGPRLDRWIVGGGQALALALGVVVLTGWVLVS